MAKQYDSKLDWTQIDPITLDTDTRMAYDAYKEAYRQAKAARDEFEHLMQANAPEGKRLVFGYNFGKLSVALDAAKDAPKAKSGVQSLSAFLAGQASSGARA